MLQPLENYELVAHRAFGEPDLKPLWEQWTKLGARFAAESGRDASRLTSLSASIEISLQSSRLTSAAMRVFRLLGRLPAGIALEDLNSILGESAYDASEALRRIGLAKGSASRLECLPPVRQYAANEHPPDAVDELAWAQHYLGLVQAYGERIGTSDGEGAVARLLPEVPNIEAAFAAAIGSGRKDLAKSAVAGFGRLTHIAAIATPTLDALAHHFRKEVDVGGEASCLHVLGDNAVARFDFSTAQQTFEAALKLYRQNLASPLGQANCLQRLGDIARFRSDHTAALSAYNEALALYLQAGDLAGEANCIQDLGVIGFYRSDYAAARKAYAEALPLHRQVGEVLGEANCIQRLGDIARLHSDHAAARKAYEEALKFYRQIGDFRGEASSFLRLGDTALSGSDHAAARRGYEDALMLYRQIGDLRGEANCVMRLGDIALYRSDDIAARRAYEEALPLYARIGDVAGEANCMGNLGQVAILRSDFEGARRAYEQALTLFRQVGYPVGIVKSLPGLAAAAHRGSDHDGAQRVLEELLSLVRAGDYPGLEPEHLMQLQLQLSEAMVVLETKTSVTIPNF